MSYLDQSRLSAISTAPVSTPSPCPSTCSTTSSREKAIRQQARRRLLKRQKMVKNREEEETRRREEALRQRREEVLGKGRLGGLVEFENCNRVFDSRLEEVEEEGDDGGSYYPYHAGVEDGIGEGIVMEKEEDNAKKLEDSYSSVLSADSLSLPNHPPHTLPHTSTVDVSLLSSSFNSVDSDTQREEDKSEIRRLRERLRNGGGLEEGRNEVWDEGGKEGDEGERKRVKKNVIRLRKKDDYDVGKTDVAVCEGGGGYKERMMMRKCSNPPITNASSASSVVSSITGCSSVSTSRQHPKRINGVGPKMVQSRRFGVGYESDESKRRRELIRRQREYGEKMKERNRKAVEGGKGRRMERDRKHWEEGSVREGIRRECDDLMNTQRILGGGREGGNNRGKTGLTRTEEELMRSLARLDFRLDEKKIAVDVMSQGGGRGGEGLRKNKKKGKKKSDKPEPPPLPSEVSVGSASANSAAFSYHQPPVAPRRPAPQQPPPRPHAPPPPPPPPPAPCMSSFCAPTMPEPKRAPLRDFNNNSNNSNYHENKNHIQPVVTVEVRGNEGGGGRVYVGEGIDALVTPAPAWNK